MRRAAPLMLSAVLLPACAPDSEPPARERGLHDAVPALLDAPQATDDPVLDPVDVDFAPADPAPALGLLAPVASPDPAWPDSVGRLLDRRFDEPDVETVENFYLYLPPGFGEDDREWPVLLYLHGRSLRGDDLSLVKRYGIPSLLERGHHLPFVVVAPQLPDGQRWVDTERIWELLEEAVLDRYPVDRDRVYATGFSMGGGGAWRFAAAHAGRLAAAAPIAATTPAPTEDWAERLEDLPVRVYHGDADVDAPYAPAATMVAFLRTRDVPVELITIADGTHDIVTQVYSDPGLYAWLLSHRR